MQVSVEELGGLERRMTVQIPAESIDPEVQKRLKSLAPRVKLDGFRPGKVPLKMVQRMYGPQVRQEVLGEMLESSYRDALAQHNLRPVGAPRIEPKDSKEGEALEFSATFEVFPEFEVTGLDQLKVERPVAQITEEDIDRMLEVLRKQRTHWHEVQRPAQLEDRVTMDFEGTIDGAAFPNNKKEDVPLVLGAGAMIKDFEDHLVGLQAGQSAEFDVPYPEYYSGPDLAGKTVHFKVQVKTVGEPHLPEIDEHFAAEFDVTEGGVEALRRMVRESMERELAQKIRDIVKQQLMDGLLATNDIPLPQGLVNAQVEQMAREIGFRAGNDADMAQFKAELFTDKARQRIALGLLVSRLAEAHHIQLDEARVRSQLAAIAAGYQEAAAVIKWYEKNPESMRGIRALVLEEQVMDWLLERAQVSDKPSTFAEIMQPAAPKSAPQE